MSMTLNLRRGPEKKLAELNQDDEAAADFVAPEDENDPGFKDGTIIDLDKAWHAIHFLLTKQAAEAALPEGFLLGGAEVGEDLGYGPARLLNPSQVADVQQLLEKLPGDFVRSTLDFSQLAKADIYPLMWDQANPEELEYVSHYFDELRRFVKSAADNNEGVVMAML